MPESGRPAVGRRGRRGRLEASLQASWGGGIKSSRKDRHALASASNVERQTTWRPCFTQAPACSRSVAVVNKGRIQQAARDKNAPDRTRDRGGSIINAPTAVFLFLYFAHGRTDRNLCSISYGVTALRGLLRTQPPHSRRAGSGRTSPKAPYCFARQPLMCPLRVTRAQYARRSLRRPDKKHRRIVALDVLEIVQNAHSPNCRIFRVQQKTLGGGRAGHDGVQTLRYTGWYQSSRAFCRPRGQEPAQPVSFASRSPLSVSGRSPAGLRGLQLAHYCRPHFRF